MGEGDNANIFCRCDLILTITPYLSMICLDYEPECCLLTFEMGLVLKWNNPGILLLPRKLQYITGWFSPPAASHVHILIVDLMR